MGSIDVPEIYDVLIIGAGLSGICSLYHIRKQLPSWRVKVVEAASGVGGTWFWNRYPGARFDSESISYGYSWDKEMLDEWHWKEAFSGQPETLKYIQRVCEKHHIEDDVQFNSRIKSAHWQETERTWLFTDETGRQYNTRFFVSCMGPLSNPTLPNIPGVGSFAGDSFHTCRWPEGFRIDKDLVGKRIGVIGTGATGVQTITEVAKEPSIQSLTVFQRSPTWSLPLRNTEITPERMDEIRKEYPATFKLCNETSMGFLHQLDPRKTLDVTEEERVALWEKRYAEPGFGKWLGVFSDTYTDHEANRLYSEFLASKIRQRVHDPAVAEKLIPKTFGFGTKRPPMESGYFEAFNRPNVHLVDLQENPIREITAEGASMADGTDLKLDVMIYATGFDAITGAFNAIEWHARDDRPLIAVTNGADCDFTPGPGKGRQPIWPDHRPRTFFGIMAPSMPNMFVVLGPHQPMGNTIRNMEHTVNLVVDLLQHCHDHGITYAEPTEEAVEQWTEHVHTCARGALSNEVDSWMTGVNTNVPGKNVRNVARYAGSAIEYRERAQEWKADGWRGITFA